MLLRVYTFVEKYWSWIVLSVIHYDLIVFVVFTVDHCEVYCFLPKDNDIYFLIC